MNLTIVHFTTFTIRLLLNALSLLPGAGQDGVVLNSGTMRDFDFSTLGLVLSGISLCVCGVLIVAPVGGWAGGETLHPWLPHILRGAMFLGVIGFIIGLFVD